MSDFPKAYFKTEGEDSAFVGGKRVWFTKTVANDEAEEKSLIKDGWLTPLTECFAKKATNSKSDK